MGHLAHYRNGNYQVTLFDDGTKVRETGADEFVAEFPENIDLKITDQCDLGCPWCHEGSLPQAPHGDLDAAFLRTLRGGTELAIGGGNPLAHPGLEAFLHRMRRQGVICNLTVNQGHIVRYRELIDRLRAEDLIHGLGISYNGLTNPALLEFLRSDPRNVVHVIAGVTPVHAIQRLYRYDLALLVLGYKLLRRGNDFHNELVAERQQALRSEFHALLEGFRVVAFDNLALTQLRIESLVTPSAWEQFYMGHDGTHTMFVDLVERQCAMSSTSTERFPLEDTIEAMFNRVRSDRRVA